jgi:hypothetical protein
MCRHIRWGWIYQNCIPYAVCVDCGSGLYAPVWTTKKGV